MTEPVFFKAAEIKQSNVQEQERECCGKGEFQSGWWDNFPLAKPTRFADAGAGLKLCSPEPTPPL
jgi:hypothetical protein